MYIWDEQEFINELHVKNKKIISKKLILVQEYNNELLWDEFDEDWYCELTCSYVAVNNGEIRIIKFGVVTVYLEIMMHDLHQGRLDRYVAESWEEEISTKRPVFPTWDREKERIGFSSSSSEPPAMLLQELFHRVQNGIRSVDGDKTMYQVESQLQRRVHSNIFFYVVFCFVFV